jgi:ATP-dependent Clp protease protease subunit
MKKALIGIVIVVGSLVCGVMLDSRVNNASTATPVVAAKPTPAPQPVFETTTVKTLDTKNAVMSFLTTEVTAASSNGIINTIVNANREGKHPIYLFIDSPGGSVLDGARVISAIQASKVPVYTVCLGICASMAANILEFGTQRYAVDRAIVMFHPASVGGIIQGELDKVVSRYMFLQRYVDKIDVYTASRSHMTYDVFKARTSRELWIDAEDALHDHLIDAVVHVDVSVPQSVDFGSNKARGVINPRSE